MFVGCSEHEGFGVPVLEAMHFDVPVVAFAAAATPEIVGDGGLLLDSKDPLLIATAVQEVLRNSSLRDELVAAGRKRGFAWDGTGEDARLVRVPGAAFAPYRPHPGIFRDFAGLDQTPAAILTFANHYGALRHRPELEPLAFWRKGIQHMAELVRLGDAVAAGDRKGLAAALGPFLADASLADAADIRAIGGQVTQIRAVGGQVADIRPAARRSADIGPIADTDAASARAGPRGWSIHAAASTGRSGQRRDRIVA